MMTDLNYTFVLHGLLNLLSEFNKVVFPIPLVPIIKIKSNIMPTIKSIKFAF